MNRYDQENLSTILANLVGVVNKKRDASRKRKEEVQNLALTDPAFAERLKNAIERDPKALDKLYKENGLEDFLKAQPEPASVVADKARASEANRVRGLQAREYLSDPSNANSIGNAGISIPELSKLNIRPDQAMKPLDASEKATLEEFRAKETGTKTSTERELERLNIDAAKTGIRSSEAAIKSSEQTTEYYKSESERKKKEEDDKAFNTRVATETVARLYKEGNKNIYEAIKSGKVDDGQKAAIFSTPKFKAQYDDEREDFWRQKQLDQQKELSNKGMQELKAQSEDLLARKTVDETDNRVSYETALEIVRNPQIMQELAGKKLADIPNKDAKTVQLWEAAQFYKERQDKAGKAAFAKAHLAFQNNAVYKKFFGDKKKTDDWTEQDIQELNDAARISYLSEGFIEAPQYGIKETGKIFKDKNVVLISTPNGAESITGKATPQEKKAGGANTKAATATSGAAQDSIPNDFDYVSAASELKGVSDDEIKKSLKATYPELKDGQIVQMLTKIRGAKK